MILNILLLGQPQNSEGSPLTSLLPILLIGVVFYLFMIRPQVRKAKQQKQYIEGIKKGDDIVTTGGLHGKIKDVKDDHFLVEVASDVNLKISKAAVTMPVPERK